MALANSISSLLDLGCGIEKNHRHLYKNNCQKYIILKFNRKSADLYEDETEEFEDINAAVCRFIELNNMVEKTDEHK